MEPLGVIDEPRQGTTNWMELISIDVDVKRDWYLRELEPGESEEDEVQEQSENGSLLDLRTSSSVIRLAASLGDVTHLRRSRNEATHDDEHRNGLEMSIVSPRSPPDDSQTHLSNRSDQEELPATHTLNERVRCEGGEGVDGDIDSTKDESELTAESEILLEDDGGEVDDRVGSSDLLHDLRRGLRNNV
jgi:hypothetical protein